MIVLVHVLGLRGIPQKNNNIERYWNVRALALVLVSWSQHSATHLFLYNTIIIFLLLSGTRTFVSMCVCASHASTRSHRALSDLPFSLILYFCLPNKTQCIFIDIYFCVVERVVFLLLLLCYAEYLNIFFLHNHPFCSVVCPIGWSIFFPRFFFLRLINLARDSVPTPHLFTVFLCCAVCIVVVLTFLFYLIYTSDDFVLFDGIRKSFGVECWAEPVDFSSSFFS